MSDDSRPPPPPPPGLLLHQPPLAQNSRKPQEGTKGNIGILVNGLGLHDAWRTMIYFHGSAMSMFGQMSSRRHTISYEKGGGGRVTCIRRALSSFSFDGAKHHVKKNLGTLRQLCCFVSIICVVSTG